MATFTGTGGADKADSTTLQLIGFTGGTIADLTDDSGDSFAGGDGDDAIVAGGAGDDINGGIGDDTLAGGDGGDTIIGGGGDDTLAGDAGFDVFAYNASDEIGADKIDGGADMDTIRVAFTGAANFIAATIASIERVVLVGAGHDVQFDASQVNAAGLSVSLAIQGDAAGADTINFVNATNLDLSGFSFSDWDEAADRIVIKGGAGADTIVGTRVADTITGSLGNDTIDGGAGDDSIDGYSGDNKLNGGAGDDAFLLTFRSGSDLIEGGPGTDTLSYTGITAGNIPDLITISANASHVSFSFTGLSGGGTSDINGVERIEAGLSRGDDAVTINDLTGTGLASVSVDLGDTTTASGTSDSATINGSAGADAITIADWGSARTIDGLQAAVTLTNFQVNDTLTVNGGAGADYIDGSAASGQIVLNGGDGADAIVGGATDVLNGNGGADFLFSTGFNPDGSMKGSTANDDLSGGDGDDGLFASNGNDMVNGGDGDDGLVGGGGGDTLNGDAGTDFLFGGAFSLAGARLDGSGADRLNGGDGDDGLYGFDGADIIQGDAGNDYIESGTGDDIANGGAGSDFVLGENGNDELNGGAGFDYLYGGAGADTFVFMKGDSADWILDFSAADGDKLRFEGFGFAGFAAVPLVDLSTPGHPAVQLTFIEGGNVDQLTIFGVTLAQLGAGNVLVA